MQSYFFQLIKILYSVIIHFAWIGKKNLNINVPTKMIHILFGQLECLKENKYNVSYRSMKTHYIYGFKARSHYNQTKKQRLTRITDDFMKYLCKSWCFMFHR